MIPTMLNMRGFSNGFAAFALIVLALVAPPASANEVANSKWFRYGPGIDEFWTVGIDPAKPLEVRAQRKQRGSNPKRVFVLYPRPSSAYDIAITKIFQLFHSKDINADFTIVNFEMRDDLGKEALRLAETGRYHLIYAMGSESTAWLYERFKGGRIPVVSVCSKDPVQLGQIPDYRTGSKTNFAFTSLNVPVEVQMTYVHELTPDLRNLTVLVDSKNISAVQTQAEPITSYARSRGIQVIWGAVQNPSAAKDELTQIVRDAVSTMRKSDPDLSKSLFWVTGSTSVFREIRTINENADRVPVLSVVPEIVRAGPDTAALSIGISFESNAHLAAVYGADILDGRARVGDLKVGVVSPPDIAISFFKTREIGMRVPFNFFESASFVYDYEGRPVRTVASKIPTE